MTSYLDRKIKALIVPADTRIQPHIETSSIRKHFTAAGFDFFERVHGANSRPHDFVMLVDEDGKRKAGRYNPRAHYLSGYTLEHRIVGGAVFCSEYMGDGGMDIQHLSDQAEAWLTDPNVLGEGYENWVSNNATFGLFTMRFPGRLDLSEEY